MRLYRLGVFDLERMSDLCAPWPPNASLCHFAVALADLGWTAPMVLDAYDGPVAGVRRYCALAHLFQRGSPAPEGIQTLPDGTWLLTCVRLGEALTAALVRRAVLLDLHLAEYAKTL